MSLAFANSYKSKKPEAANYISHSHFQRIIDFQYQYQYIGGIDLDIDIDSGF